MNELELEDEEYIDEDEGAVFDDDIASQRIDKLPKLIDEFVTDCDKIVKYNSKPSALMFLTLLGQTVKDFVAIPNGTGFHEDSRLHFCWIQTSGTGKSALMNFVLPISEKIWQGINELEGYRPHELVPEHEPYEAYDNFDVVEYTAAALLGHQNPVKDEDGEDTFHWMKGELDGNGLARWDEFTNSGVFDSKNQHKEGIVTYLNTMMNTIHGKSWKISKKLLNGPKCDTLSQRSIIAATFPPKHFEHTIADTGLFQRMLLYIWEVPEAIQDSIRDSIVDNFGRLREEKLPIDKYANDFLKIYELTKARCDEVGDSAKTVSFSSDYTIALQQAKNALNSLPNTTSGQVRDIAKNFLTRLIITLGKISVLCCLAETTSRTKATRFIVTGENVVQAREIVHNCYKSLVEWLELSLKVNKATLMKKAENQLFFTTFDKLEKVTYEYEKDGEKFTEHGYVRKNELFNAVMKEGRISKPQLYVRWRKVENEFITKTDGRTKLVKKIGE